MFVLDSHCDTPSQILRLRDMTLNNDHSHVDFPKLRRGGIDGAFWALYVPAGMSSEAGEEYAYEMLGSVMSVLESNREKAALALSPEQALANKEAGLFSVFLALENGSPIGSSIDKLYDFYDAGIRYMTLSHSANNLICDSCASDVRKWNGLSPFGREVVGHMNRLGMMIDVSHISDESFYDVLECSRAPVVASHSCCRALAGHPRNMTDDMIRALAAAVGVIQINFFPVFLDSGFGKILDASGIGEYGEAIEQEFIACPSDFARRAAWYGVLDELEALERPSYKKIADHIDHVVSLVGIDHVGLGSDFDGIAVTPRGMEDASCFPVIFDELRGRGYSEPDVEKIAGANFLRVFSEVRRLSGLSCSGSVQ